MIPGSATGSDPSPVLTFSDYISRMEEDPDNMVAFDKGEDLAYCRILIIDDSLYEEDETFQVMLSNPMGGRIGNPSLINVIISGDSDDGKFLHGKFVEKLCGSKNTNLIHNMESHFINVHVDHKNIKTNKKNNFYIDIQT